MESYPATCLAVESRKIMRLGTMIIVFSMRSARDEARRCDNGILATSKTIFSLVLLLRD